MEGHCSHRQLSRIWWTLLGARSKRGRDKRAREGETREQERERRDNHDGDSSACSTVILSPG